jgi:hypothetical protein
MKLSRKYLHILYFSMIADNLFSFLHPYSKGDLGGGFASLACVHTYTWNATRSMCCLNAASDGGSLTREESFDLANIQLQNCSKSYSTILEMPLLLKSNVDRANLIQYSVVQSLCLRLFTLWYNAFFKKMSTDWIKLTISKSDLLFAAWSMFLTWSLDSTRFKFLSFL